MCRLTVYVGPPIKPSHLVTKPSRSIIKQSYEARERVTERGYLNGDGFGLGWYPLERSENESGRETQREEPCIFASTGPAWNNTNLSKLADSIEAQIIFAHVRAATEGTAVTESNLHPFQHGKYMFMHNGNVGDFAEVRRLVVPTLHPIAFDFAVARGSSDSALCFAMFLHELLTADLDVLLADSKNAPLALASTVNTRSSTLTRSPQPSDATKPQSGTSFAGHTTGHSKDSNSNLRNHASEHANASSHFVPTRRADGGSTRSTDDDELRLRYSSSNLPRLSTAHGELSATNSTRTRSKDEGTQGAGCKDELELRMKLPLTANCLRQLLMNVIHKLERIEEENGLESTSMLNFLLTDGATTICTRYLRDPQGDVQGAATLYFAEGSGYTCHNEAEGLYRMSREDSDEAVVIVASEPLTNTTYDWVSVPTNYALIITADFHVLLAPIHDPRDALSVKTHGIGGPDKQGAALAGAGNKGGNLLNSRQILPHPTIAECLEFLNVPSMQKNKGIGDYSQFNQLKTFQHHLQYNAGGSVLCMCVLDESHVLCGYSDGCLVLWETSKWEQLAIVHAHKANVLKLLAIEHDEGVVVLSTSSDCTIMSWLYRHLQPTRSAHESLSSSAFSPTRDREPSTLSTVSLHPLSSISCMGMGDILSLVCVNETIYAGFQDTNIRKFPLHVLMPSKSQPKLASASAQQASLSEEESHSLPNAPKEVHDHQQYPQDGREHQGHGAELPKTAPVSAAKRVAKNGHKGNGSHGSKERILGPQQRELVLAVDTSASSSGTHTPSRASPVHLRVVRTDAVQSTATSGNKEAKNGPQGFAKNGGRHRGSSLNSATNLKNPWDPISSSEDAVGLNTLRVYSMGDNTRVERKSSIPINPTVVPASTRGGGIADGVQRTASNLFAPMNAVSERERDVLQRVPLSQGSRQLQRSGSAPLDGRGVAYAGRNSPVKVAATSSSLAHVQSRRSSDNEPKEILARTPTEQETSALHQTTGTAHSRATNPITATPHTARQGDGDVPAADGIERADKDGAVANEAGEEGTALGFLECGPARLHCGPNVVTADVVFDDVAIFHENMTRLRHLAEVEAMCKLTDMHSQHFSNVYSLIVRENTLISGGDDGLIKFWDLDTDECIATILAHHSTVWDLFSCDDTSSIISVSADCTLRSWDFDSHCCSGAALQFEREVLSIAEFNNLVCCSCADGTIHFICPKTLQRVAMFDSDVPGAVTSLVHDKHSPDRLFMSCGGLLTAVDVPHDPVTPAHRDTIADGSKLCAELDGEACLLSAEENGTEKSAGIGGNGVSRSNSDRDAADDTHPHRQKAGKDQPTKVHKQSAGPSATESDEFSSLNAYSQTKKASKRASIADVKRAIEASRRATATVVGKRAENLLCDVISEFVSIPSVSSDRAKHAFDCFKAAKFLLEVMGSFGCDYTHMLVTEDDKNPLVLGRMFVGQECPTVLVYGHYDVMPVDPDMWSQDNPFVLTARDGYWYGRGVTDDKGPIIATLMAASNLKVEELLKVNLLFMYEGEAEHQSGGFVSALKKIRSSPSLAEIWDTEIDHIFISNNFWIDDHTPCVTYAMRGHISLEVSVSGPLHNLHAGVDGGAVIEPTFDLCCILSSLTTGDGRVCVPGFYDGVEELSASENESFANIVFDVEQYKKHLGVTKLSTSAQQDVLRTRWAQPTLSVTDLSSSNHKQEFSILPNKATAQVSIRFVPHQDAGDIIDAVKRHLNHEFSKRGSGNTLEIEEVQISPWWKGETDSSHFQCAIDAVKKVWGVDPYLVCEGGTMHTTGILVEHYGAPALHLPMGQSSDGAHLPNERIRISNMVRGAQVVEEYLLNIGRATTTTAATTTSNDEGTNEQ